MKKTGLLFLLILFSKYSAFSQFKLIQGTVLSEQDSSAAKDVLVILHTYDDSQQDGEPWNVKRAIYHTTTDSNGIFTFRDIQLFPIDTADTMATDISFKVEMISPDYWTGYEYIYTGIDVLDSLKFYVIPYGYTTEDTTSYKPVIKPYAFYTNLFLFGGSLFNTKYQPNYKFGISLAKNYKISPINYLAWELNPLTYRRYTMKNDTINTRTIFPKEYYASMQSGLGVYFRTHIVTWNEFKNGLYTDLGMEYVCPWHYWYIGKPDGNTKFTLKNFHKYNELYLNARIGMINGLSVKGSYRLTDIFKSGYMELPQWSVELQAVFLIGFQ